MKLFVIALSLMASCDMPPPCEIQVVEAMKTAMNTCQALTQPVDCSTERSAE